MRGDSVSVGYENHIHRIETAYRNPVSERRPRGWRLLQRCCSGSSRLLGDVVPAMLQAEVLPRLGLPKGDIGVWLAGDFYTVPALDKRGGSGDVRPVWDAFATEFDWVAGVAGNHDTFPDGANRPRFTCPIHFLDNDHVTIGGVSIAGLSGIPGNPKRPWRRTEDDYVETLGMLLCEKPAITIMHEGPSN